MSAPRVLCFLDNPSGRDTEIVLPVIYVMEKYCGADVRIKFIWDFFYMKRWTPDVVLLPNTRGHHMYVEIAEFAKKNQITVLALDSEGNFPLSDDFDYWGYNKQKTVFQDWVTCWSDRVADFTRKKLPATEHHKIITTGGTGFDRYRFGNFANKADLLEKYQASTFKKVIGYAGWAFGKLYSADKDMSFTHFFPHDRPYALQWLEDQRIQTRESLRYLIEQFPDVLFLLKKHPKENFESDPIEGPNEMNELLDYPNVRYFKNEEPIHDLINICDLWMGFETTTLFEAWLLDKPTLLINRETAFPRSSHYKGSVIVADGKESKNLIEHLLVNGNLDPWESPQIKDHRVNEIQKAIGFGDGRNHLRTMYYFIKSIPKQHKENSVPINWRHLRLYLLMHLGRFLYNKKVFLALPGFKKSVYVFENRTMSGLAERKAEVYSQLNEFYQVNQIDKELKSNNWEIFAPTKAQ